MQSNQYISDVRSNRKRLNSESDENGTLTPPSKRFQTSLDIEVKHSCSATDTVVIPVIFNCQKTSKNPIWVWPPFFGSFSAISWQKVKFSKLLQQICQMPHREDTFQIPSPSHVCCSNKCTFSEISVLRFEIFAHTVFIGKSGFSKNNNSG